MNQALFYLLLLSLIISPAIAIIFKLTNVVCESYNKSVVTFGQCRLRAVNRNKVIMNMEILLIDPVNDVLVQCQLMKKANGYKPWLYKITFNACEYAKKMGHPVIKIIYNLFKDFSNLNHTCPYEGLLLVKDFYLGIERLPLPMPTGDYLLLTTWIFNKQKASATNFYFTFVEDF